jgi:hypothetical protein
MRQIEIQRGAALDTARSGEKCGQAGAVVIHPLDKVGTLHGGTDRKINLLAGHIQRDAAREGVGRACGQRRQAGSRQAHAPDFLRARVGQKNCRMQQIHGDGRAAGDAVASVDDRTAGGEQDDIIAAGVIHALNGVVALDGGAGGVIDLLVQDIQREVRGIICQSAFDLGQSAAIQVDAPECIRQAINEIKIKRDRILDGR